MGRGGLFATVLLLSIVVITLPLLHVEVSGVTYSTTTTTRASVSSTSAIVSKTSTATSVASALSSIASSSLLNDLPVLKNKFPKLFNPNLTYIEFASTDLSSNPKFDDSTTFRNVTIRHRYVSGMLVPSAVEWDLTHAPPNVSVFLVGDYGTQVPISAMLTNSASSYLTVPRSGNYPHVYLFLVS